MSRLAQSQRAGFCGGIVLKITLSAALAIALVLVPASAGTSVIGTASARGSMRVDGSLVNGNATLFDGSVVETDAATTALRLDKGIELKLATESRGQLYRDHLVLQKGSSELVRPGPFRLVANSITVASDSPGSRGVVSMKDDRTIEVSALAGDLKVTTSNGLLLAMVKPGRMMAFNDQQAGATAPTTVSGKLVREEDKCSATHEKKFYVIVQETGAKYEVTGSNLDALSGKTVTLTGTPDPSVQPNNCAAGLIVVSSAAAVAGAAVAGAAAGTVLGLTTAHLIIAGVVVAAAAGTGVGLYEANKGPSSASP